MTTGTNTTDLIGTAAGLLLLALFVGQFVRWVASQRRRGEKR